MGLYRAHARIERASIERIHRAHLISSLVSSCTQNITHTFSSSHLTLSLSRSSLFISHRLSFISHLSIHCKAPCHALSLAQHKLSIARYMQVYYKQTHPSDAPSSRAHTRSRRSWRRDLRAARRTRVSICVERSLRCVRSHRPKHKCRPTYAWHASSPLGAPAACVASASVRSIARPRNGACPKRASYRTPQGPLAVRYEARFGQAPFRGLAPECTLALKRDAPH